jgi:hypothetical protein
VRPAIWKESPRSISSGATTPTRSFNSMTRGNTCKNRCKPRKRSRACQLEVRALTRMSVTEYLGRNTDQSIALSNQAIAMAQENGIEYWAIDSQIRLGNAYIVRADYGQAESQLDRALESRATR